MLASWGDRLGCIRRAVTTMQRRRMAGLPIAVSVLVGALSGLVWSVLAPPEQVVVVAPGVGAALTGESLHRFDALALFACGAFVAGIVLPVAFWAWTRARGPMLYLGLLVGAALGSAAMLTIGIWIAGLIHPRPEDSAVGSVVSVAPGIGSLLVLVVQPLITSLVVVLLAAMNPHDNLRYTPDEDVPCDELESASANGTEYVEAERP